MKLFLATIWSLIWVHQTTTLEYPGTSNRPILSEEEASKYTIENYFSGWEPEEIEIPDEPDYVVSEGQSIQAVVNEAIKSGSSAFRTYIKIEPGHYMETVYIKGDIPLTIYGDPDSPEDVHIMATISAQTSVADYQNIVNENGVNYQEGDPAWELYKSCAIKEDAVGIECSAVFWVQSNDFQLLGVTIHNGATEAQALAIKTSADKIHLMNNNFMSIQDTLGLGIDDGENEKVERVLIHMCYVEGELDYVIGGASAVFNMVTFHTVASVEKEQYVIFMPDTAPGRSYGFLVINSDITGDDSYLNRNEIRLARSWDKGVTSPSDYVVGESPNGQLVIRDSNIDNIINVTAPYTIAGASKRPFSTDISPDRDLDDNSHNRLWEYNNNGEGAQMLLKNV